MNQLDAQKIASFIRAAKSRVEEYDSRTKGKLCLNCGGIGEHVETVPRCQEVLLIDAIIYWEEAYKLLEEKVFNESKAEVAHKKVRDFGREVIGRIWIHSRNMWRMVTSKTMELFKKT